MMSSERVQKLRLFVSQVLNSALEEILSAVDKMIDEYEQEAAVTQQVVGRQHALLCALQRPVRDLPSTDSFTQLLVPPQNQEQNLKDPDPPQVPKDQKGNHLQDQDLNEDEIIRYTYHCRSAARPEPTLRPGPGPGPSQNLDQQLAQAGPRPGAAGLNEEVLVVSSGTEDSEDWTEIRSVPDQPGPHRTHRTGRGSRFRSRSRCWTKTKETRTKTKETRTKTKETQTRTPKENQTRTKSRQVQTTRVWQRQTGPTCKDCGQSFILVRKRRRHRCRLRTWILEKADPGPPRTRSRTQTTRT